MAEATRGLDVLIVRVLLAEAEGVGQFWSEDVTALSDFPMEADKTRPEAEACTFVSRENDILDDGLKVRVRLDCCNITSKFFAAIEHKIKSVSIFTKIEL